MVMMGEPSTRDVTVTVEVRLSPTVSYMETASWQPSGETRASVFPLEDATRVAVPPRLSTSR